MTNTYREWFLEVLEKKNMNQSDLARALGRDRSAVTRLLSGERGLRADEQDRIAEILGVSVEEFSARRNSEQAGFSERSQAPFRTDGDLKAVNRVDQKKDIDDEDLPDHPIWGSMAGTITVMPGVDLTQPMDFEWSGKLYNE